MAPPPAKKSVTIDVNEFVRTRDALGSAYISLSASIDRAVKAYLDHTNVVLAGDTSLDVSYLTQPFNQLAQTAQQALLQNGVPAVAKDEAPVKGKRKKRTYKARDPNAPKRPLTAYFIYLKEQRAPVGKELAATIGKQKPGEIASVVTKRWNAMSKEQQQPWRDQYQRALTEYEKKAKAYQAEGGKLDPSDEKVLAGEVNDHVAEVGADVADEDEESSSDDSTDSDDDDDEDDDEEEVSAPPPPQPKATSPDVQKKTPKSALKKTPSATFPTPKFSSLNAQPAVAAATEPAPSSSPDRKRKAAATTSSADAPEGGPKKRGRKTNAEKAAAAEVAAAESAAAESAKAVATPSQSSAASPKKERKKAKKADA